MCGGHLPRASTRCAPPEWFLIVREQKTPMRELDVEMVATRLAAVLAKARKEAMAYTVLTVLCTPAFVAIVSFLVAGLLVYVLNESRYRIDNAQAIYAGMTVFIVSTFGLATTNTVRSSSLAFDRRWLAGGAALLALVIVTYATPLRNESPVLFGIIYFMLGFLVLGLAGRAYANHPAGSSLDEAPTFHALVLAASDFVLSAYGELLSASWLWFPPKPHEIRIAARVLCRLGAADKGALHECVVDDRIERLLHRLGLAERTDQQLHLTPKGLDFIRAAATM